MKTSHKPSSGGSGPARTLTLGDLIASTYNACGDRAPRLLQLRSRRSSSGLGTGSKLTFWRDGFLPVRACPPGRRVTDGQSLSLQKSRVSSLTGGRGFTTAAELRRGFTTAAELRRGFLIPIEQKTFSQPLGRERIYAAYEKSSGLGALRVGYSGGVGLGSLSADVKLPAIFGDHMVLQSARRSRCGARRMRGRR